LKFGIGRRNLPRFLNPIPSDGLCAPARKSASGTGNNRLHSDGLGSTLELQNIGNPYLSASFAGLIRAAE